ncbi:hypothetical protein M404DRAFT_998530 [Pisolithus tinctorius Marx 270]|uniref:Uncharacterized protein n=1 Tax=Pisolithus tinctorius Marx 270 TaxID=870435 RepID=A0A0C3PGN1_PISTI|nr:hypothetical protein M404DRAFT_998530 [Pisolithus tinctorius Marx 270]
MSESISVQHPPAIKVGGRRLSISNKHKAHTIHGGNSTNPNSNGTENADYPRPTAHETDRTPQKEDEAPKKQKKQGHRARDDKQFKENPNKKLDAIQPTRDSVASKHGFGAAGRIGQPMSKGFIV